MKRKVKREDNLILLFCTLPPNSQYCLTEVPKQVYLRNTLENSISHSVYGKIEISNILCFDHMSLRFLKLCLFDFQLSAMVLFRLKYNGEETCFNIPNSNVFDLIKLAEVLKKL